MGKYYLKKSYIKEGINLYGIRFILGMMKNKFPQENKVLIKIADGIGDILVRSKLVEIIIEKYGRDNVYFLMKKEYTVLGELLGYKTIGYSREERKNFFKRLKKMYYLNKMGFSKYINLEFANDITVGNIFSQERIGLRDENISVARNNKYYTKSYDKLKNTWIMETIKDMGEKFLNRKLSLEEILPDLSLKYKSQIKEGIIVVVGTSSREKVCSPERMVEYIEVLKEKYPEEKIYLVGHGKDHEKYSKELLEKVKDSKNIVDMVNKTTLEEVFRLIGKSKLFVGFDSGLYNFAFVSRIKTIGLFSEGTGAFIHKVSWVKILTGNEEEGEKYTTREYSNRKINGITLEKFRKTLEIKVEEK